jgi:AcrR family transcriptional regulator
VVYEHFGDRPGLLVALYRRIDQRQVDALLAALERTPRRLESVVHVMSTSYMSCYSSAGPEWHAITAALQGDEHMAAVQQELLDGYVADYQRALAPFSRLSAAQLHLRCVGIIGAAEAISREMLRGRADAATAAAALEAVILGAIETEAPGRIDVEAP